MTTIDQNSDDSKSGKKRSRTDKVKLFKDDAEFTKMSNVLLDVAMPKLSPYAWKLLCLYIRKTRGWGKDSDTLAYPRIKQGIGTNSGGTVDAAIRELLGIKKGGEQVGIPLIKRTRGASRYDATSYELNLNVEISEATLKPKNGLAKPRKSRPKNGLDSQTNKRSTLQTDKRSVLIKKEDLKKDEEEDRTSSSASNFQNSPGTEEKAVGSEVDPAVLKARQRDTQKMFDFCSLLLGARNKPELHPMARNVTENLLRAGRTPDQLHRFGIWWLYCYDHGGPKGRLPWPSQIEAHWDEALKTIPDQETVADAIRWAEKHGRTLKFSELSVKPERFLSD